MEAFVGWQYHHWKKTAKYSQQLPALTYWSCRIKLKLDLSCCRFCFSSPCPADCCLLLAVALPLLFHALCYHIPSLLKQSPFWVWKPLCHSPLCTRPVVAHGSATSHVTNQEAESRNRQGVQASLTQSLSPVRHVNSALTEAPRNLPSLSKNGRFSPQDT